jgi:VanZ family protein
MSLDPKRWVCENMAAIDQHGKRGAGSRSLAEGLAVFKRLSKHASGCVLLLVIAVLSFVPPAYRPITSFPHSIEHIAIYAFTGLAFGLSQPTRYVSWFLWLGFYAATIEIVQLWVPGRHARMSDFVIDVVGLSIGLGMGAMLTVRQRGGTSSP